MTVKDLDLNIYGPWYQPFWYSTYFWLITALILVGLVSLIVWLYRKYYKSRLINLSDNLTPQQRALRELEQLLKAIPNIEKSADFYSNLVTVLKKYLVTQFTTVDLLAKTDLELFDFLQVHGNLTHGQSDLLSELLTARAKARFAALSFDQALARHDLYRCMEFVEFIVPIDSSETTENF
ncbi:MAG TPA: DUF4381 family protein [Candidatus Babeliales bacterium]|nr:DUF4381 family protein [Candidatus Babeliales bacterium]